jgi:hypothetical protein
MLALLAVALFAFFFFAFVLFLIASFLWYNKSTTPAPRPKNPRKSPGNDKPPFEEHPE